MTNLEGQRFGMWLVISRAPKKWHSMWNCVCKCGTQKAVDQGSLCAGLSTCCGCNRGERMGLLNRTHGMRHSSEYCAFSNMHTRCTNPKFNRYKNYGHRGISVCKRWKKFENFFADMGPRPTRYHSVDRIDNNKGYSPDNCRWATRTEQARNMSTNVVVEINGRSKCLSAWAEELGKTKACIYSRINRGIDPKTALTA